MESLAVHITPKANRNEVVGITTDSNGKQEVSVRVTSAPEGGKANKAVCETIAKSLRIAKGCVTVARGQTSRHKMLSVDITADELHAWLASLK